VTWGDSGAEETKGGAGDDDDDDDAASSGPVDPEGSYVMQWSHSTGAFNLVANTEAELRPALRATHTGFMSEGVLVYLHTHARARSLSAAPRAFTRSGAERLKRQLRVMMLTGTAESPTLTFNKEIPHHEGFQLLPVKEVPLSKVEQVALGLCSKSFAGSLKQRHGNLFGADVLAAARCCFTLVTGTHAESHVHIEVVPKTLESRTERKATQVLTVGCARAVGQAAFELRRAQGRTAPFRQLNLGDLFNPASPEALEQLGER